MAKGTREECLTVRLNRYRNFSVKLFALTIGVSSDGSALRTGNSPVKQNASKRQKRQFGRVKFLHTNFYLPTKEKIDEKI